MKINKIMCLFLMLTASVPALAQKTVTGTVSDETMQPIIGASIVVKGAENKGTITDVDGNFSLANIPENAVLTISCIGFSSEDVSVSGRSIISVILKEDANLLNELVVIGYGTQRKGDVTSAVARVKADDFNVGNINDAGALIQGKVAGLNIANGSGDPSSTSTIRLRGVISLEGSTTPLVLVDGIEGSLSTVAPESIESIDVLKDASAAAIYGTRGANGVIIITTKGAKRNENVTASYTGYASFTEFANTLEFMDADDIRAGHTDLEDKGTKTDWLGEITRTALTHSHNVNISGGLKNTTFYANAPEQDHGQ